MFFLFSCYTHKIVLNSDNNSGTMIIEYQLDDDYFQLLSIAFSNFASDSQDKFDPVVLIDEELFRQSFKNSAYIRLKSVNINAVNGYKGKIVIDFTDLEKLLASMPKELVNLNFIKENGSITLSQSISLKKMDPDGIFKDFIHQQKEDDINFYNKLTKEAEFNFIIQSQSTIKKAEGVVISKDKKNAYYNFKLNDIIVDDNKIFNFLISL